MFPPAKQYCALSREPTQADRSSIYRSLCEYGKFTGLWWILSPEPEPVTLPMLTIEEIIYSDGFLQAHGKEDQLSFFKEKCKIQSSTIQEIAKLTVQGPTNIFYKTCPWASGMQKSLAQKDEVVVPCHRWYKCCRNYFAPFSGNK